MSIRELPRTAARPAAAYQLRLHGGTEDERLINVPPGKQSIGSGPRCQIRLEGPGIAAMECLLICDRAGLRVRRWSEKTRLNGEPFEEACLAAGDVLAVGPIELVVESREVGADGSTDIGRQASWTENNLQAACDAIDDMFLDDAAAGSSPHGALDDRPSRPTQRIVRTAPSTAPTPAAPPAPRDSLTKSAVRRRSRRALALIRRQRRDHDELLARVTALGDIVAKAIAEPVVPQPAATDTSQQELTAAHEQLAALNETLAAQQEQLEVRDSELKQARFAIDALERQLIDSQHTMNAFAEERARWDDQISEIESRMTQYVDRIQELEQQLAAAGSITAKTLDAGSPEGREQTLPVAEAEAGGIDWAAELGQPAEASANEVEFPTGGSQDAGPACEAATATTTVLEEMPQQTFQGKYDWQEIVDESVPEPSQADVETAVASEWESAARLTSESTEAELAATEELSDPVRSMEVHEETPAKGDSDSVEQALEHLRGVSIWREEPAKSVESSSSGAPEFGGEPTAAKKDSAPVSFLDRYAHMFPDDESAAPPTISHEDTTVPLREAAPPPAAHTEEESVEQYMAKLLERMRGGPAGSSINSRVEENQSTATEWSPAPVTRQEEDPPAERPKFTHLGELKTKAAAPEQPSDMAAMRALANQSARQALSLHAARKLRRTAITRVIVTALAASVAVYLLLNSTTWRSLAFAAGCAAAFASLYWGLLTMGTVLKGFQLGAFDDYEEEVGNEKSLNPPLPIDIIPDQLEKAIEESAANDANEQTTREESAPTE